MLYNATMVCQPLEYTYVPRWKAFSALSLSLSLSLSTTSTTPVKAALLLRYKVRERSSHYRSNRTTAPSSNVACVYIYTRKC